MKSTQEEIQSWCKSYVKNEDDALYLSAVISHYFRKHQKTGFMIGFVVGFIFTLTILRWIM